MQNVNVSWLISPPEHGLQVLMMVFCCNSFWGKKKSFLALYVTFNNWSHFSELVAFSNWHCFSKNDLYCGMTFCCHVFNIEQTFESLILKRSTNLDRKQFPSRVSQVSIFLHFTHRWLLRKQLHVSFSVCTFGATYFCSTDLSMVCNPQNRLIPFVSPFENDFP